MLNSHGKVETGLVAALFEIQEGLCFHCGHAMLRGAIDGRQTMNGWSREHPIARDGNGGRRSLGYVLAHPRCNGKRGARPLSDAEWDRVNAIWATVEAIHGPSFLPKKEGVPGSKQKAKKANPRRWLEPRGAHRASDFGVALADFWPTPQSPQA